MNGPMNVKSIVVYVPSTGQLNGLSFLFTEWNYEFLMSLKQKKCFLIWHQLIRHC